MLIAQFCCLAQDTTRVKYKFTIQPTQFLFKDFPLTFEKMYDHKSIGFILSYRPGTQNGGEINGGVGLFGYYLDQNFFNDLYNAFTFGICAKNYFNPRKNLFLEADLFYRYWWFDDKVCQYNNVEGYRFNGTRTEHQNVYGIKVLFGNSIQFKVKSKVKPVIDLFCGIGLRFKTYLLETRDGTVNDLYYVYKKEKGSTGNFGSGMSLGIPLSFHAGFRIGFGF